MRKALVSLAILAVLAGSGIYLHRGGYLDGLIARFSSGAGVATRAATPGKAAANENRSPVEVAAAAFKQMSDDISAIGTLMSDESVQISSESSGRINTILFQDGDKTEAGAVLIELDDALVGAQLADAKARLKLAQANYDRASTLRKSGNATQSTLDQATSELAVAQSVLESTRRLLALRRRHPALIDGELRFIDGTDVVLGFERSAPTDTVLCVFNLSGAPARGVVLAGRWRSLAGSLPPGTELAASLSLPAYGFVLAVPLGS